jgi:hypothetical protein
VPIAITLAPYGYNQRYKQLSQMLEEVGIDESPDQATLAPYRGLGWGGRVEGASRAIAVGRAGLNLTTRGRRDNVSQLFWLSQVRKASTWLC